MAREGGLYKNSHNILEKIFLQIYTFLSFVCPHFFLKKIYLKNVENRKPLKCDPEKVLALKGL